MEKGHHLQEIVWPDRNFIAEQHEMEIEADLIGAWALALQNQVIRERPIFDIVRRFNDLTRLLNHSAMDLAIPMKTIPIIHGRNNVN